MSPDTIRVLYVGILFYIYRVSQKIGINDLVWFDYDLVDSDCVMVLKRTQGTATNRHLIQAWSGSGQTLGYCFAYDAERSEQHGTTLHYNTTLSAGTKWMVLVSHDF